VFGPALRDDVLSNVSVAAMAPLIGDVPARAAALAVRTGYLLSLLGSFVLLLFPLRHVLADVWLGGHDALAPRWLPVTIGLTAAAFLVACFLSSIFDALSVVGATATTTLSWIIPALLMLVVERRGLLRARPGDGAGAAASAATNAEEGKAPGGAGGGDGGAAKRVARRARAASAARQALAVAIFVIGVLMFANAIVGAVVSRLRAVQAG
jgi:hypothetical protein